MTTLQRVTKEDVEEGKIYAYQDYCFNAFGRISDCEGVLHINFGFDCLDIDSAEGQFYGPIELKRQELIKTES